MLVGSGLALGGLGAFFTTTGLDRADKVASVIGTFATLIGLGLSVYGVVLARRSSMPKTPGSVPSPRGETEVDGDARQHVQAGRDAYVSGGNQYFGTRGHGE